MPKYRMKPFNSIIVDGIEYPLERGGSYIYAGFVVCPYVYYQIHIQRVVPRCLRTFRNSCQLMCNERLGDNLYTFQPWWRDGAGVPHTEVTCFACLDAMQEKILPEVELGFEGDINAWMDKQKALAKG